ncbi:MAG: TIR domain-containing protein [Nitrospira sp.]|nr:TIR domain-containing protein [Nitrospira sp.]
MMDPVSSYKYKTFMSYSHAADGRLASALQSALYQFAKPWHRKRAMEIFRDETGLNMNNELWPTIKQALSESEYFLLLASTEAAKSESVQKEVAWWLEHRTAKTICIVLTEGEIHWDRTTEDYNWSKTDALPSALQGKLKKAHLIADLRFAKTEDDLSLQNPKFHDVVRTIAATLNNIPPQDMQSEEIEQQKIVNRLVWSVVLLVLMIIQIAGLQYLRTLKRDSYVANAISIQRDGQPGQRVTSLTWLKKAAEIRPNTFARDQAIRGMTLVDLIPGEPHFNRHPLRGEGVLVFDPNLERYARTDNQGNIVVRRVSDHQTLAVLAGLKKPPTWVLRFSSNGQFIAAKDQTNQLHLWDLRHGNGPSKVLSNGCEHPFDLAFDFSLDSQLLAFSHCDGHIHLFNIASGQEMNRINVPARDGNAGSFNFLAFHPNSQRVAISSNEKERAVQILNLIDGKVVKVLAHNAGVHGIAWSDDGKLLATACQDSNVYIWDLDSQDKVLPTVLSGHRGQARYVSFNKGHTLVVSSSWDQTVRLWDPMSGRQLIYYSGSVSALPLQFSTDGQRLAFRLGWSEVGFWDVKIPHEYRTLSSREGDIGPFSADFSLDGRLLVSAHSDGLRLWDIPRNMECRHINERPDGTSLGSIRTVAFHGNDLVTGIPRDDAVSEPGSVNIWRIETNSKTAYNECPEIKHLQRLELPQGTAPRWVSSADDGKTVAVADDHGQIVIFDSRYQRQKLLTVHPNTIFVTVSPDGRWVASSTRGDATDNVIEVFDLLTSEKPVKTFSKPSGVSVAFSPDNKWLVTGTGEEYAIWKIGSWEQFVHSFRREHSINLGGPIAFSADGKILAVASSQDHVKLLNASGNWEEIATLVAPDPRYLGWMRFSRTAQLAAVTQNQVIQLWDLPIIREQLAEMRLAFGMDALTFSGVKSERVLNRNES